MNNTRYFIYCRKSTDTDDKQVRSTEDQIAELRGYARQNDLQIADIFIEKQTAKKPGRPIFNGMLEKIENGEADGILAWHPDRLARNSVDGGKIIYLLDTDVIKSLAFPTFWFEPTSQGKFALSMAFTQSKYFVDNLSENVKRGYRNKLKRGEYPSRAPFGYVNNTRLHKIVIDEQLAPAIRMAFEQYSRGNKTLQNIADYLYTKGFRTRGDKPFTKDRIKFMLSNPFYIGLFRYCGEIYEGNHEPLISQQLFDKVQDILEGRSYSRKQLTNTAEPYCGLIRCGNCGMAVTAERKTKRQKNGNIHYYTYYRCTRKNKSIHCTEKFISSTNLDNEVSDLVAKYTLKPSSARRLREMAERSEAVSAEELKSFLSTANTQLEELDSKIGRLLDLHLDGDINRIEFSDRKQDYMLKKKSINAEIEAMKSKKSDRLGPLVEWTKTVETLGEIAQSDNQQRKKAVLANLFGSDLQLASGCLQVRGNKKGVSEAHTAAAGGSLLGEKGAKGAKNKEPAQSADPWKLLVKFVNNSDSLSESRGLVEMGGIAPPSRIAVLSLLRAQFVWREYLGTRIRTNTVSNIPKRTKISQIYHPQIDSVSSLNDKELKP